MKYKEFFCIFLMALLLVPSTNIHAKNNLHLEKELDWVQSKGWLKDLETKDLNKTLSYEDFGQIFYTIYHSNEDPSLKKMAKDIGQSQGITWLKSLSLLGQDQKGEDGLSRIESIYLLHGLYNRSNKSLDLNQDPNFTFTDYEKIKVQYKVPLAWVQKEKLFLGNERGEILPESELSLGDLVQVLYRGKDLFEDISIVRPIYFQQDEINRIQMHSFEKLGMHLEYTGQDHIDNIRNALNSYQGQGIYQPSDGWTHSITVFTKRGDQYKFNVFEDTLDINGLIIKDPKNAQAYKNLEEYLLK